MALVELSNLRPGAPTDIAVARLVQIRIRDPRQAAKPIVSSCQFVRERLVLEEAALRRGADCLLVQGHGFNVSAFEASPFRRSQRVLMRKSRWTALRPTLKR